MVAEKFQQHKSQMVPHSQTGTQPNRGMLETKQRHHTSQPHLSNIRSHEERDLKNSEDEEIQVGHSQLLMLVTIVKAVSHLKGWGATTPTAGWFHRYGLVRAMVE